MNESQIKAYAPAIVSPDDQRGQSVVELAIIIPVLIILLFGAADMGRVFYCWIGVNSAARAGAQYGSQSVITAADSAGMKAAAQTDAANVSGLSVTASQCTCASSYTVNACPSTYCTNSPSATYVEVDTQAPFHTVMAYPGIPSLITVSSKAIMQVQQ
ncbi:MAG: pilus assembly protein [Deltaproteobacteria bacterium]|nr:pilus assembly protein [Deltaproteobacteria bacterium]